MPSQVIHRGRGRRVRRLAVVTIGVLVACSTWAGQAYAQTPDGTSAVDQYVEDVPTSSGSTIPGKNKPKKNSLPPSVSNQIERQGGSDAAILREVASSPDYGAPAATPPKAKKKAGAKAAAKGDAARTNRPAREEGGGIPAPSDSSASEAVSAAVSAAQGGDAARLVGLLIALFVISLAALTAAGLRHRRRAGAG
jgi:hypothetical protein